MVSYLALGMMSGSSLDGLDLALVRFTAQLDGTWLWQLLQAAQEPYTQAWTERLQQAPSLPGEELMKLHADYGHYLGITARRHLLAWGIAPDALAVLASHGHTVFHQPHRQFTVQLGCGETLVTHVAAPVVTNFRSRDVALGGEGAPLVPGGERTLFPDYRLFLNLGGIANLSVFELGELPPGRTWLRRVPRHLGFDVCGCNQLLNHLAQRLNLPYDTDGQLAASGQLEPALLEALSRLDFQALIPPRSLSNEYLRQQALPLLAGYSVPDALHTVCHYIAREVRLSLIRLERRGEQLLVSGGGAHHRYLMHCLEAELQQLGIAPVLPSTDIIDYKEAIVFAYLGLCRLRGEPNVLPDVTGARQPSAAGSLHLPAGYRVLPPAAD